MLTKVLGIFVIVCCGALKMPLKEISRAEMQAKTNFVQIAQPSKPMLNDTTNRRNTVYIKEIKYTHDGDSGTCADMTIKNTTKETITYISFLLDGHVAKGCNKCYEIKQKINLKPNQLLTISQRLAKDDCEAHVIKNIRIRFTINVNFTLD